MAKLSSEAYTLKNSTNCAIKTLYGILNNTRGEKYRYRGYYCKLAMSDNLMTNGIDTITISFMWRWYEDREFIVKDSYEVDRRYFAREHKKCLKLMWKDFRQKVDTFIEITNYCYEIEI